MLTFVCIFSMPSRKMMMIIIMNIKIVITTMYIGNECLMLHTHAFVNIYTGFLYIDTNKYHDSEPPLLSLLTSSVALAKISIVVMSESPKRVTQIAVKTCLFTLVSNKQA